MSGFRGCDSSISIDCWLPVYPSPSLISHGSRSAAYLATGTGPTGLAPPGPQKSGHDPLGITSPSLSIQSISLSCHQCRSWWRQQLPRGWGKVGCLGDHLHSTKGPSRLTRHRRDRRAAKTYLFLERHRLKCLNRPRRNLGQQSACQKMDKHVWGSICREQERAAEQERAIRMQKRAVQMG